MATADQSDFSEIEQRMMSSTFMNGCASNKRETHYEELQPEKNYQFVFSASITICYGILLYYAPKYNFNSYNVLAIASAILMAHFFFLFFVIIISCEQLHFVRIRRMRSSMGGILFVPYGVESDKEVPIRSISEIIGLRGSNVEKVISAFVYLSSGIVVGAATTNMMKNPDNYYTNIMATCCAFGTWLTLTWQLEYNVKADFLHYVGVTVTFCGAFGALIIQQNWSILSVSMAVIAIICGGVFVVVRSIKFKAEHIYYQSIMVLLSEGIIFILITCSMILYVYQLDDGEEKRNSYWFW